MKKLNCIIFIVLLCLVLLSKNIKANESKELVPLIILKDTNYNLELDGYILKENNVDITKEGSYLARYVDKDNNSFYRIVEVVSSSTLLNDLYVKQDLINSKQMSKYDKIVKVISSSYGDIILKIVNGEYILDFDFYYKFITSDCIGLTTKLEVIDIYFDEYLQICYGIANTKEGNIYLFMVGTNGEVLNFIEYGGSNVDTATFIYTDLEYIYIGGQTVSNDSIFKHTASSLDSYVLKIDKISYELFNYFDLGEAGDDYISCFDSFNKVVVKSIHYDSNAVYKIIDLNDELNVKELVYYNDFSIDNLVKFNNNLYILGHDDTCLYLYEYSDSENLLLKKEKSLITSCTLCATLNEVRMYELATNKKNLDLYSYVVVESTLRGRLVKENVSYKKILASRNYLYLTNDTLFDKYAVDTMYSTSLGSLNNSDVVDPVLFINGVKEEYVKEKSNTFIDPNVAGTYALSYFYQTDVLECYLSKNVEVTLISNILSGNTYLVGLSLYSNLDVYINGEIVSNGYIFTNTGNYHIKVCGKDYFDEFDITIIEYSENINSFDLPNEINIEKVDNSINIPQLSISKKSTNIMLFETNYFDKLWYLLIPFTATLILGTLYFTIGRKWL